MKFWSEEFLPSSRSSVSESFFLLEVDSQKPLKEREIQIRNNFKLCTLRTRKELGN